MKRIYIGLLLILPIVLQAQQLLSLKAAIDTTLENSFGIRIAENNVAISKVNNHPGVAGALPTVNASITDNQSLTNVNQELNNGTEITKSNASGNALNSSLTAGMLLFNGFKVVATKEKLEQLQKQSELLLNLEIQNTIALVMTAYYDVVRQQEYLKIIRANLEVSETKLEWVKQKQAAGLANDADLLQAQLDLSSVEQAERYQLLVVEQSKTSLQEIMSMKSFVPVEVQDTILVDQALQLERVLEGLKQNPQYLSSGQQIRINEMVVKEVSAQRYPSLRLNTGVNFNRSQSAAGFTLLNQNYGPYAGLSLQVPIYNGNAYKAQKEVATFNVMNARLQQENLLHSLKADAIRTFQSYTTNLQQLELQQGTVELSAKLIAIVMERFRLNQATLLDIKAAQASFENSGYQLVNLSFAAKVAEVELKRLSFQLGN
ncbi:MAG: TolC family protein [Bacteroidales bacterium]|nr:TolC family protein [Bacteroidales bacterium]